MSSIPPIDGLEITQDLAAQQTTWAIQRMGWAAMALIIMAALAGLFGSGPLARMAVVDDQQLVRLEYDRFGRYEGELLLKLDLTPKATQTHRVTIQINRDYWTSHAIGQIAPAPMTSSTSVDGFLYTFEVDTPNAPAAIIVRLRPEYLGSLDGHIRVNDQGSLTFQQFIFP
ncbi:MAG: hypothetical protein ACXWWI_07665 [Nitrospira sp.]